MDSSSEGCSSITLLSGPQVRRWAV